MIGHMGALEFTSIGPFVLRNAPIATLTAMSLKKLIQKQWLKGYLSEIQRVRNAVGPRLVNSVFFGGGTPSLMDPEVVESGHWGH